MTPFATLLAEYRNRAGFSQAALARKSNVGRAFVSYMESNGRHPSFETVCDLSEALGLDDDDHARLLAAAGYWPTSWNIELIIKMMRIWGVTS